MNTIDSTSTSSLLLSDMVKAEDGEKALLFF